MECRWSALCFRGSSKLLIADSVDHGGLLSPMKPIDSDIEIIKIAMKIDFAAFEPRFLL